MKETFAALITIIFLLCGSARAADKKALGVREQFQSGNLKKVL